MAHRAFPFCPGRFTGERGKQWANVMCRLQARKVQDAGAPHARPAALMPDERWLPQRWDDLLRSDMGILSPRACGADRQVGGQGGGSLWPWWAGANERTAAAGWQPVEQGTGGQQRYARADSDARQGPAAAASLRGIRFRRPACSNLAIPPKCTIPAPTMAR